MFINSKNNIPNCEIDIKGKYLDAVKQFEYLCKMITVYT